MQEMRYERNCNLRVHIVLTFMYMGYFRQQLCSRYQLGLGFGLLSRKVITLSGWFFSGWPVTEEGVGFGRPVSPNKAK